MNKYYIFFSLIEVFLNSCSFLFQKYCELFSLSLDIYESPNVKTGLLTYFPNLVFEAFVIFFCSTSHCIEFSVRSLSMQEELLCDSRTKFIRRLKYQSLKKMQKIYENRKNYISEQQQEFCNMIFHILTTVLSCPG